MAKTIAVEEKKQTLTELLAEQARIYALISVQKDERKADLLAEIETRLNELSKIGYAYTLVEGRLRPRASVVTVITQR